MNKNDFLDILRDYLKGTFSEHEINDILRDYEEFFLNGELQGKSNEEIIKNLGSPKSIAKELMEEMKGQSKATNNNGEIKDKISRDAKNLWRNVKTQGTKAGNKTKKFLDSNSVLNGKVSAAGVKIIMIIITVLLFFPSLAVATSMVAWLFGLIAMSIGNFVGYIGAAVLMGVDIGAGIFGIFACFAWTGFTILFWTIYSLIYKGLKYLVVKYVSWIKTRNMYVRVKNQQESGKNQDINVGENVGSHSDVEYNHNETFEDEVDGYNLKKEIEYINQKSLTEASFSSEELEDRNSELTEIIDVEYEDEEKKNKEDGAHE
ncbi:MAG: DUF1700 domain-containing protein [Clostridium sp.]|uniref:DUF1700 domain-containing protein n=1 Tax=Clostridium sp. TaxID=1506 RepID=UPI003041E726